MSQSTEMIYIDADLERFIDRFRAINRKHREQFFNRQRMVRAYSLDRRDQEFCIRRDRETGCARDVDSFLSDCHGLHGAGFGIDHGAPELPGFFLVADVGAQIRKFLQHQVIDLVIDHHRLLGGADGSVVEGLGGDDVHDRHVEIGSLLQIDGRIACSHSQGRLARTVGGFDHARAARSVDQGNVFVMHQVGVVFEIV